MAPPYFHAIMPHDELGVDGQGLTDRAMAKS
jgi:hypothetical protein